MDLKIDGRNVNIGRRLQAHVDRKLGQIVRHLPAATDAKVEITFEPTRSQGERYLAQLDLNVKGALLRAEGRGPAAASAVSAAAGRLDLLAGRFKGQVYRSQRARNYLSLAEQQAADAFEQDRELAREFLPEAEAVETEAVLVS